MRSLATATAVLFTLTAGLAAGEDLAITHDAVGCIVAGKFPRIDACFAPPGDVARARVYFRKSGTPYWYYVDLKTDGSCMSAFLPRARPDTGKIDYYIEAVDKTFTQSRTPEYNPDVVGSAEQCKKKAAPFSNNANVIVGAAPGAPLAPLGFGTAGLSTGLVAGGVVVLGAGIGTAVALNNNNDSPSPSPNPTPTPTPQPTPTPTPVPSPTTPNGNQPPNPVFNVNPRPPAGPSPLNVTFNMCPSSDPDNDPLSFTFDFGDGSVEPTPASCRAPHTYNGAPGTHWTAHLCVTDGFEGHERCHDFDVQISSGCENNKPPKVTLTQPKNGQSFGFSTITVAGNVNDPDGNFEKVQVDATDSGGFTQTVGVATSTPFSFDWNPCGSDIRRSSVSAKGDSSSQSVTLTATATDACFATGSTQVQIFVSCFSYYGGPNRLGARRLTWTSQLDAQGAAGQVVLNGQSASFPASGLSHAVGEIKSGAENRIEAQLVSGSGKPGTWRFELLSRDAFVAGSLRVVAGEVASITENAVVFRLSGNPGDRVVFAFKAK